LPYTFNVFAQANALHVDHLNHLSPLLFPLSSSSFLLQHIWALHASIWTHRIPIYDSAIAVQEAFEIDWHRTLDRSTFQKFLDKYLGAKRAKGKKSDRTPGDEPKKTSWEPNQEVRGSNGVPTSQ
jgi:hypothetical protein